MKYITLANNILVTSLNIEKLLITFLKISNHNIFSKKYIFKKIINIYGCGNPFAFRTGLKYTLTMTPYHFLEKIKSKCGWWDRESYNSPNVKSVLNAEFNFIEFYIIVFIRLKII